VNAADKRIEYSIEDYGVVFSLRGPETGPLSVRQFKVDPITFEQGLQAVTPSHIGSVQASGGQGVGGGGQDGRLSFITRTQAMQSVSLAAATFFTSLGVDLISPNAIALGKSVFWGDRKGVLLVRATKQDLDAIEHALSDLASKPKSDTKAVASPTSVELGQSTSRGQGTPSVGSASPTNGPSGPELYTRSFQVDPKTFREGLMSATGLSLDSFRKDAINESTLLLPGVNPREADRVQNPRTLPPDLPQTRERGGITYITRTNNMQPVSIAAAAFFDTLGLDLASSNAIVSGKAIYWNDRRGTLLVRATKQDLDVIERAIEILAANPENAVNATGWRAEVTTNKPANGASSTPDQSRRKALTNTVPVLGDLPFIGKLFRSESPPDTNGSFGNALPKSLYQSTPGPRIVAQLYFQVELREDGSYWAGGKQMNLAELRDWLVKTKQSDSNRTVVLRAHSNAPHEAVRALTELDKELVVAIEAPSALAGVAASAQVGQLNMRSYKVDPSTFYKGLQSVSRSPVNQTNVPAVTRDWFATLGVDWSPPKSIVWNDRSGFLQVRATEQDLDIIEAAMEVLNRVPPQINIKVRFVEIAQEDTRAHGFDWYLGNILMGGGTSPVGKASPQFQGILTDPQFRVLLRAFEQRHGVDLLTTPEVTTVSGRQAQIQVVNMQTVVTGINPQVLASPGSVSTTGWTNGVFQTQVMPFGPTLDVIPYITPDGYKIQMTVIPTVTEFLGYDGSPTCWPTNSIGLPTQPVLPLPHFRTRQMMVTAIIRDGQTLVLANPTVTETFKKPDGSTETKDVSGTQKKQLIVFVTPTLVDETGNRIHRDDEPAPGPK